MLSYHYPIIAREGWKWIALVLLVAGVVQILYGWLATPLWVLFLILLVMFRDPAREIPASPLGIVSPADGEVISTDTIQDDYLNRTAIRVSIRMDLTSVYSIHSPMEGKLMEQWSSTPQNKAEEAKAEEDIKQVYAQWIQSDEGDDVILMTQEGRLGARPRCYAHSGERIGQGQRCGFISLGSVVHVLLPESSRLAVEVGDSVRAGSDIIATLVHPGTEPPGILSTV